VTKLLLILLLAFPCFALAENDGEELLDMMRQPAGRKVALAYIDDVRARWNGSLFCIVGEDPQAAAFDAVKSYLESHAQELYRLRRYLIVQGLRAAFPCPPR
jgi:hypothetical protein